MRRKSLSSLAKRLKSPPQQLIAQTSAVDIIKKDPTDTTRYVKKKDDDDKKLRKAYKSLRKMSNDELETLLSVEDNFLIDCILDQVPEIMVLKNERDILQEHVVDMATLNCAREPDYVRDRLKLRDTLEEVDALRRQLISTHLHPTLNKLNQIQDQLASEARKHEERSEKMAQEFLDGEMNHDDFIDQYIKLRKETSEFRIKADKLAKERANLAENVIKTSEHQSPIPTPRRRKRMSYA